jgi:hypothetical protein
MAFALSDEWRLWVWQARRRLTSHEIAERLSIPVEEVWAIWEERTPHLSNKEIRP